MKQTTFTTDERNLLQGLLKKRLDNYNKTYIDKASGDKIGIKHFENFYIKPMASALDKILNHESAIYSSKEKLALMSCANEHYDHFYKELNLSAPLSWVTISDYQRNVISKLDNCKNILLKCGYYNTKQFSVEFDKDFRYSNILTLVEKLKRSNRIFLSGTGQNDYYKIAFVYDNKEYLPFELKHHISLRNINFISLNGQSPDSIATKKFSLITTKPKAKELIASCESKNYPVGVLDFVNALLD
jgi:hypothetical protein